MTVEETTALLTPLALAMRVEMDGPTYRAYAALLKDVPAHLAALGLEQWLAGGPRFFPTAPEIQSCAEKARRQQLALHPWTACCECEDQPGWRVVIVEPPVSRLARCECVARHQQGLKDRGLFEAIAVLPGEAGAGDTAVYPTLEQLPAPLQQRLQAIADQKVLK